jgi:hypothetical protein
VKRILSLLAFGAFAVSMQADTILPGTFPSQDPGFTATVDLSLGTLVLATPGGPDLLNVFDAGNNFLVSVFATDLGTPGLTIATLNSAVTQEVAVTFNQAGASLDGAGHLLVPGTGTPLTAITDPGLLGLIGGSTFVFGPSASTANPFVFDFDEALTPNPTTSTPEPSTVFTAGIALFAIAALRLKKKTA